MEEATRIEWATFVIRLRRETQGGGWHGQIVHLASQTDRHFVSLPEVIAFLAEHAPGLAGQAPTPPASSPET